MLALLLSVFILSNIQSGASSANSSSKQNDYIEKSTIQADFQLEHIYFNNNLPVTENQSVKDIPLPGVEPPNQSVKDIPLPGVEPTNQSVTDIPLPGVEPPNQSVKDIPLPGVEPPSQSVKDIPLPGVEPPNQSVTDIPLPGVEPPNQSVKDIPLPGVEPPNQSVIDIPLPEVEHTNQSVKDIPLPGVEPPNQSVKDIPLPGVEPTNQSVTDIPAPGINLQNQTITDIWLTRTDPQNTPVTDILLTGRNPANQSMIDTLLEFEPPHQSETDMPLPKFEDPQNKAVTNISPPDQTVTISPPEIYHSNQSVIDIFLSVTEPPPLLTHRITPGCELQPWIKELSSKSDTPTNSAAPQNSSKKLEILEEFLVEYKKTDSSHTKQCYNDTKCVYFGDCCPDKHIYPVDRTYEFYKCTHIKHSLYSTSNYLLVSKCLSFIGNSVEVKAKCEQDSDHGYPPVMSNEVGRFYRNKFCAKCNGDLNFTRWHVEIALDDYNWLDPITRIRSFSDFANFRKLYKNNYTFKIPNGMTKPWICDKQFRYIDRCNLTSSETNFTSWELIGCHSHTDPVGLYRNIFCKKCNQKLFCGISVEDPSIVPRASFGALMDLSSLRKYKDYLKVKEKEKSCQLDEFYDQLYENCRPLYCSTGLFLTPNSSCSYIPITSASNLIYKIHFSLIPRSGGITVAEALNARFEVFETMLENRAMGNMLVTLKFEPRKESTQKSPSLVNRILFYFFFEAAQSTFVKMDTEIEKWISKLWRAPFMRSFYIVKDLESLRFTESYLSTQTWNKTLYKPEIPFHFPYHFLQRALTYSDIRPCPKVMLSSEEFSLNEDNFVISINARQVNLTMDHVEFNSNGTPMICLSDYLGVSLDFDPPSSHFLENILTWVFLSASLLCLAMTLTTYAIFSELRTLPGKFNIFLCGTLFIAQALILLGAYDNEIACALIGSIRHYVWLSTFGWLGVCSFHMYRVFTNLLVSNDQNPQKILVRYALAAYGIPLLIVASTVVSNTILYGVGTTGYGLPNCFVSEEIQLIVSFALPVFLIILFNTSILSFTIHSLIKTSKQCRIANKDKRRVLVYLKISSLSGITWVFGFLSMCFHRQNFVLYVFIVSNASQGIYIFFSFILNAHVLGLYAAKFISSRIRTQRRLNANVYTTETVSATSSAEDGHLPLRQESREQQGFRLNEKQTKF